MSIGQELLDIPIADMVANLASAVAEGQMALDKASIATLKFLADDANAIGLIPEVAEIVQKVTRPVDIGTADAPNVIDIDSVDVRTEPAAPVKTTLLQAGILPTFYQFTEALIEVKLSITMKRNSETDAAARPGQPRILAFASPVNYRTKSTFSYEAQGASMVRITMKPVPAPAGLLPDIISVNTIGKEPVVIRNDR